MSNSTKTGGLTSSQRSFYNSASPGVKATITRKLRDSGNSANFKKWFNTFKKSHS